MFSSECTSRYTGKSIVKKGLEVESEDELDLLTRLDLRRQRSTSTCEITSKNRKRKGSESRLWQRHTNKYHCSSEIRQDEIKTVSGKKSFRNRTYSCKYCQEIFESFKLLRDHKKKHKPIMDDCEVEEPSYKFDHLQDLYICGVCSAEFQEESEAKEHLKSHQEVIICSECDKNFKSYYELGLHSAIHNPEHKVHCPLCSYVSSNSNPYSFKAHVNYVHLKKFPFYCKECGKGFKQYKIYQEHHNSHLGQKPYVCVVCQKGFTFQKYLQVHQVRNHQVGITGNKIENECRTCNRYFYKPEALKQHIEVCYKKKKRVKSESPVKAFLCDSCGQTFTEKAKLLEHLRVHKGDLPFVCSWCGKRFPVKAYLKTHERVHTGEKPYSCEFCGKRFGQHAPFRVHRRTHTGERPYVCEFCNKGFTTNQGLKLHKRNCSGNQVIKTIKQKSILTSESVDVKIEQHFGQKIEENASFGYF